MMMTDQTKWGPRIDRPENGWPGGKCPIPWAKVGDYEIMFRDAMVWFTPMDLPAEEWEGWWRDITAYRVRADLMHRVQPAATDVVEKMAEALDELLNYSGGADSALEDEYVVDRATAALAAYAASKEAGR